MLAAFMSHSVGLLFCLSSWAHAPDPSELKMPRDEVQYDIQIIDGHWDPEPAASPNADAGPATAPAARRETPVRNLRAKAGPRKAPPAAPARVESVQPQTRVADPSAPPRSENYGLLRVVRNYLILGFQHILPEGTDHILFVLGLFFFSTGLRALLLQVSVFTLAHTVTLILSTLHVARLPSAVVEPVIAASIAFVALENLFHSQLTKRRLALIFAFGLLHGMGFAGALAEVGLPSERLIPALLSFNVGVELGQLTVVALAFAAVAAFRDLSWYRRRVVVPASVLIALIGLFWTVTRLFPSA